jgi:hypothetical protein
MTRNPTPLSPDSYITYRKKIMRQNRIPMNNFRQTVKKFVFEVRSSKELDGSPSGRGVFYMGHENKSNFSEFFFFLKFYLQFLFCFKKKKRR